ncbi:hypothetical protein EBZ38_10630 [bacterium]|nr:hypothetical protein [bacterium]
MFGVSFYHNTIRKYVVLFGTLFNNIFINREDTNNDRIVTIKVPISYSPKEKMLARIDGDPELKRPAIVLPRMGFELRSLNYASERKLNTLQKMYNIDSTDTNKIQYNYMHVPYDLNFILNIAVKNADDGTRILEQILPYFTPSWNSTVNLIPEIGLNLDIPVVLNSVTSEDTYDGGFENRRALTWTLEFTLKGYIFGPVKSSEIIKLANTNFYDTTIYDNINDAIGNTDIISSVDIEPGLLANGSPTSNSSLTVNVENIDANDNYGYIITKT